MKNILKKTLLTALLTASAFSADSYDSNSFCPLSRVFIDIMKNCQDVATCRNSCHMLSNIAIASSSEDDETSEMINDFELHKHCDGIDESKLALKQAWANALIETAEYNRKLENC